MSVKGNQAINGKAEVDFECLQTDCGGVVKCDLAHAGKEQYHLLCPKCHHPYSFEKSLREKFNKFFNLILAVRDAESILGDCNVAVAVPGGEVKIPYALLLTRLNTMITLEFGEEKVDFHFRVEPASSDTFR